MAVTQGQGLSSCELRNRASRLIQQSNSALRTAQQEIERAKLLSSKAEALLTVCDVTEKGGAR